MTGSSSSSLGALRVWTGDLLPRENGSEVGLRCSVVKSSCYSCRGVGFDSQQTQLYKTAHNHLVPGGSIAQPGTHVVHKYTCMQTSIYVKGKQINLFFIFLRIIVRKNWDFPPTHLILFHYSFLRHLHP